MTGQLFETPTPVGPRVYSMRQAHPDDAVYVGRSSLWGNPYTVGEYGRERALELYRRWVMAPDQEHLRNQMRERLRGKNLVCWCKPAACHADIILEIANE